MAPRSSPVTFQLVGGLGNQLFGYFAGQYFESQTNFSVRYDLSQIDKGFTAHGSSIRSFSLEGNFGSFKPAGVASSVPIRALGLLSKKAAVFRSIYRLLSRTYDSEEIGFDSGLVQARSGYYVRGYFQSYKYVLPNLSNKKFSLELASPSKWYLKLEQLAIEQKPIMVHVRRGDYEKLSEEFGVLSAHYYARALDSIAGKVGQLGQIWVFSDEITKAKNELFEFFPEETMWISPPEGADPAETMKLMTLGSANVISNSTFSWWAAVLNPDSLVVAPRKWFKGKNDPEELYPPTWLLEDSLWRP